MSVLLCIKLSIKFPKLCLISLKAFYIWFLATHLKLLFLWFLEQVLLSSVSVKDIYFGLYMNFCSSLHHIDRKISPKLLLWTEAPKHPQDTTTKPKQYLEEKGTFPSITYCRGVKNQSHGAKDRSGLQPDIETFLW